MLIVVLKLRFLFRLITRTDYVDIMATGMKLKKKKNYELICLRNEHIILIDCVLQCYYVEYNNIIFQTHFLLYIYDVFFVRP